MQCRSVQCLIRDQIAIGIKDSKWWESPFCNFKTVRSCKRETEQWTSVGGKV